MNATIKFTCPRCQSKMSFPISAIGRQGKCGGCQQMVIVHADPRPNSPSLLDNGAIAQTLDSIKKKVSPLWIVVGLLSLAMMMLVLCGGGGIFAYFQFMGPAGPDAGRVIASNADGETAVKDEAERVAAEEAAYRAAKKAAAEAAAKKREAEKAAQAAADKKKEEEAEERRRRRKLSDEEKAAEEKAAAGKAARDKAARDKAARDKAEAAGMVNIPAIQDAFNLIQEDLGKHLADMDKFKKNDFNDTYTFVRSAVTGDRISKLREALPKPDVTSVAKAVKEQLIAIRRQALEGNGRYTGGDVNDIVEKIIDKIQGNYPATYAELQQTVATAKLYVQRLEILPTADKELDKLKSRLTNADPEKAQPLKDMIDAQIAIIASIDLPKGYENTIKVLNSAIANARKVETPKAQEGRIRALVKDPKGYFPVIVEMLEGNPLVGTKQCAFGGKSYWFDKIKLGGKKVELDLGQLNGNIELHWSQANQYNWLQHFATKKTGAKLLPPTEQLTKNVYPFSWLGLSISGKPAEQFKLADGKYTARVEYNKIGILMEILDFDPLNTPAEQKPYVLLFVEPNGQAADRVNSYLLAIAEQKLLVMTYGYPGAKVPHKVPISIKTGGAAAQNTNHVYPNGFKLVSANGANAALAGISDFRWRIKEKEETPWNEVNSAKLTTEKVNFPDDKSKQLRVVNIGQIPGFDKHAMLVFDAGASIIQTDAFDFTSDDKTSYLLKWFYDNNLIESGFNRGFDSAMFFSAARTKDFPSEVVEYAKSGPGTLQFKNALKKIGMAENVFRGGYSLNAQTVWKSHRSWLNSKGPKNDDLRAGENGEYVIVTRAEIDEKISTEPLRLIQMEQQRIATAINTYRKLQIDLTQVPKALLKGNLNNAVAARKKVIQGIQNQMQRQIQIKATAEKALNAIETQWAQAWTNEFSRLYIILLKANLKKAVDGDTGIDLFTKRQKMISTFELQVMDNAKPGATYKLIVAGSEN